MSAINLIIARGFGPEVKELGTVMGDEKNRQRNANEVSQSNQVNTANAQQDQQFQIEDRGIEAQGRQKAQALAQQRDALFQRLSAVEARLQANPNDPQAIAEAQAIDGELQTYALKNSEPKDLYSILNPKPKERGAPVKVQNPDGSIGFAYPDDAVSNNMTPYVKPPAATGTAATPTKPPTGYMWNDPSNPAAGVTPLTGGPADPNTVLPMTAAEKQAQAAAAKQQGANERAFNAYTVGISNVLKQFEGTETGPVLGRLLAYTEAQQKAEGAEAAMLPILKQLFRSAGEGVFTDKDQILLERMAPTRADRPGARIAKINNINQIVAAKLGMQPPAPLPEPGAATPKTFTTQGGATVEILD
jgi:hypothetical protein